MRLRFTIRDLLWLTLVVALAVGWWLDSRIATDKSKKLEVQLRDTAEKLVGTQSALMRETERRILAERPPSVEEIPIVAPIFEH